MQRADDKDANSPDQNDDIDIDAITDAEEVKACFVVNARGCSFRRRVRGGLPRQSDRDSKSWRVGNFYLPRVLSLTPTPLLKFKPVDPAMKMQYLTTHPQALRTAAGLCSSEMLKVDNPSNTVSTRQWAGDL